MKKLILPLLVAGAIAVPSLAQAESYYISVSSGLNLMDNSTENQEPSPNHPYTYTYKPGVLVNCAVGLKSGDLRLEAEVGFRDNKVDEIKDDFGSQSQEQYDIAAWTFMANGYYDFDLLSSCVTPYVMGGIGSARMTRHYSTYSNYSTYSAFSTSSFYTGTSVVFAWQVGAGLGIKASKDIAIDLGYRYLKPSDINQITSSGVYTFTFGGHEILAGLRYAL